MAISTTAIEFEFNTDVDATFWPPDLILLGTYDSPIDQSVTVLQGDATHIAFIFTTLSVAAGVGYVWLATPPTLQRDMAGTLT